MTTTDPTQRPHHRFIPGTAPLATTADQHRPLTDSQHPKPIRASVAKHLQPRDTALALTPAPLPAARRSAARHLRSARATSTTSDGSTVDTSDQPTPQPDADAVRARAHRAAPAVDSQMRARTHTRACRLSVTNRTQSASATPERGKGERDQTVPLSERPALPESALPSSAPEQAHISPTLSTEPGANDPTGHESHTRSIPAPRPRSGQAHTATARSCTALALNLARSIFTSHTEPLSVS